MTEYNVTGKQKTRLLLLHPPFPLMDRRTRAYPLALLTLASYLREHVETVDIRIYDCQLDTASVEEAMAQIQEFAPDMVGITLWSCQAPYVYELADHIHQWKSDCLVMCGGAHSAACTSEVLEHADIVVIGEGEETLVELVQAWQASEGFRNIKGIAFRDNGGILTTPLRPLMTDINKVPLPAWDLINLPDYFFKLHVVGANSIPIIGARGCPHNCSFCSTPFYWRRNVRWMSPERVVDEMEAAVTQYGVEGFHFYDDNFLLKPEYALGICEEIKRRDLDLKWVIPSRAEDVVRNPSMLKPLAESGCVGIEIGIESFSNDVLSQLGKSQVYDEIEQAIKLQQENGLYPLFTIMSMAPGETIQSFALLRNKMIELIPDWPTFEHMDFYPDYVVGLFSTPHPGTVFAQSVDELGVVVDRAWENFHYHQLNFIPNSLLNDIPVKQSDTLTPHFLDLWEQACKDVLWGYYPNLDIDTAETDVFVRDFVEKFFSLVDGQISIREIATSLAEQPNIAECDSLRLAAFSAAILGQHDLIT